MNDPQTRSKTKKQADATTQQQNVEPGAESAATEELGNWYEANTMSIQQAISTALVSVLAQQTEMLTQTIEVGLQRIANRPTQSNAAVEPNQNRDHQSFE